MDTLENVGDLEQMEFRTCLNHLQGLNYNTLQDTSYYRITKLLKKKGNKPRKSNLYRFL